MDISVREMGKPDIDLIVNYWSNADRLFLTAMGVDLNKVPNRSDFSHMLLEQLNTPIENKRSYCLIWELDKRPIGHSNTNPTFYGREAFMHLHIWSSSERKKGIGSELIKLSLIRYFENLKLKRIFCEPYALNPAPNKTLEKIGFDFMKEYRTTPGSISFEQPVKRWELTYEKFKDLFYKDHINKN